MKKRSPKTTFDPNPPQPNPPGNGRRLGFVAGLAVLGLAALGVFAAQPASALEPRDTRVVNFRHVAGDTQATFEVQVRQGLKFYRAEYYASETNLSACWEDVDLYGPNQGYTRNLEDVGYFYKEEGDWRIWGYKTDDDLTAADRSICIAVVAQDGSSYNFHGPYALGQPADEQPTAEPRATTTAQPVSAAATAISGIEESQQVDRVTFSVETAVVGTTNIQDVSYYVSPVREHDCSQTESRYGQQPRRVSTGRHQVDFAADSKRVCLRVAYQAHPSSEIGVDFHDFEVNATTTVPAGTGSPTETTCADAANPDNCEARQTIDSVLNLMAILVMPIVSIMIIIGGIQYSMAGNNSDAINAARARIYKAILALICFVALWSFLKWLIPGGLE